MKLNKLKSSLIIGSVMAAQLLTVSVAHAVTYGGLQGATQNLQTAGTQATYGTAKSLPQIVGQIIQIFLGLIGIITLVLMVYGGYLWMTAQGEEKQVDKAKDTIKNATIGLIIILAAYAITSYVVDALTVATQ